MRRTMSISAAVCVLPRVTIDTCTEQALVFPISTETVGLRETPQQSAYSHSCYISLHASPTLFFTRLCRTSLLLVGAQQLDMTHI